MASDDPREKYKSDFGMPFVGPPNEYLTNGQDKPLDLLRKALQEHETGRDLAFTIGGEIEITTPSNYKTTLMEICAGKVIIVDNEKYDDAAELDVGYHHVGTDPMTPPRVIDKGTQTQHEPEPVTGTRGRFTARRGRGRQNLTISTHTPVSGALEQGRSTRSGRYTTSRLAPISGPSSSPTHAPSAPLSASVADMGPEIPVDVDNDDAVSDGPTNPTPNQPPHFSETQRDQSERHRNIIIPYRRETDPYKDPEETYSIETAVTIRWDTRPRDTNEPDPDYQTRLDFPPNKSRNNISPLLHDMQPTDAGYELSPQHFSTTFSPHDSGMIDLVAQALLPSWSTPEGYEYPKPEGRSLDAHLSMLQVHCGEHILEEDPRYNALKAQGRLPSSYHLTNDNQFGRLIVVLPYSLFKGGELIVRPPEPLTNSGLREPVHYDNFNHHRFELRNAHKDDNKLKIFWAAWHKECDYTVCPVTEGFRVSVVYDLYRVRGNPLMGGGLTARQLTLHKVPMYQPLRDLLRDEEAWGQKGGYVGFMLVHAYPHASRAGDEIGFNPEHSLRGVDFLMYQMVKEMFTEYPSRGRALVPLDVQIRPVVRLLGYKMDDEKDEHEQAIDEIVARRRREKQEKENQPLPRAAGGTQAVVATAAEAAAVESTRDKGKGKEKEIFIHPEPPVVEEVVRRRRMGQPPYAGTSKEAELYGGGEDWIQRQYQIQTPAQRSRATQSRPAPGSTQMENADRQESTPSNFQTVQGVEDTGAQEETRPRPVIGCNYERAYLKEHQVASNDPAELRNFFHRWSGRNFQKPLDPLTPEEVGPGRIISERRTKGYYIDFDEVHWLNCWGHEEVSIVNCGYNKRGPYPRLIKTCLAMIIKVPPGGIEASEENRALWPEGFGPKPTCTEPSPVTTAAGGT